MMLESQFDYRRVGDSLFHEIVEAVMNKRRSHVLLGARNAGKRYIMHRLPERLRAAGATRVVSVDFHRLLPWQTEQELAHRLFECFTPMLGPAPSCKTLGEGSLVQCLKAATAVAPGLVLLASGVDELGPHLSLLFLQVARSFVQTANPALIVVLTGEVNFQDLVHGPGSAFENCARQIVIQGYDEDEFAKVAASRARVINLEITPEANQRLFQYTGGQYHLLDPLLHAWQGIVGSHAVRENPAQARKEVFKLRELGTHGLELLHHAADLIKQYPAEWPRLERLIQGEETSAGLNNPGPLEFAGLAVRDEQNRLRFCSPLIRRSVQRYFNPRRWGDWYAQLGMWEKALAAYEGIDPALRLRPSGPDDRPVVWELIREFGRHIYSLASQPAEKAPQQRLHLRTAFQRGMQLILGVRSVSFWCRGEGGTWVSLAPMEPPSPSMAEQATLFLPQRHSPSDRRLRPGWLSVPSPEDLGCLVALMSPERDDQPEALVISEIGSGHVLTRERRQLIRDLGEVFLRAYDHLSSVARAIQAAQQRERFEEIAADALIGVEAIQTPRKILEKVAADLMPLGYRRLLFSLVDPGGTHIRGEVDKSWNTTVNVAEATNYPVNRPDSDIQAWVVHHREPRRVSEPLKEPGVNYQIVQAANIGPFALLPLLGQNGEALGTLHVEREDGSLPTEDEVDDLISFGRRLSQVVERCERVTLYQPALQLLRDAIVIVDNLNRVRFANSVAKSEFNVREGWQDKQSAETTRHVFKDDEEVLALITPAIAEGRRSVLPIQEVGRRKRQMTVVAQPIHSPIVRGDRNSKAVIGVMLHFRDHHYMQTGYEVINSLNSEINVRAYVYRLLELPKALGHRWARLWFTPGFNSDDPSRADLSQSRFIGKKSYHLDDPELDAIFTTPGGFNLNDAESARAMREGKVVIYEMTTKKEEPYVDEAGLPITPFLDPPCSVAFKRQPGHRWINFPLRGIEGKMIGMLSMDVPKDFRPRNLNDLDRMAKLIGVCLSSLLESRHIKAASERAIADTAHEVGARLVAANALVSRFRGFARRYPQATGLVDALALFANRCMSSVNEIKNSFVVPAVKKERLPVRGWLAETMKATGWDTEVTIVEGPELWAHFDPLHIERCLVELLRNADDFAQAGVPLRVVIDAGSHGATGDSTVWITVQDNGRGIPESKRELVTGDFYSYRPGAKQGPRGLGLATARRTMEAHGGFITIGGHAIEDGDPPELCGAIITLRWPDLPPLDPNAAPNPKDDSLSTERLPPESETAPLHPE